MIPKWPNFETNWSDTTAGAFFFKLVAKGWVDFSEDDFLEGQYPERLRRSRATLLDCF